MSRRKPRKKLRTRYEVWKAMRKPNAPPSRKHGDARKEDAKDHCRRKDNDDE